MSDYLSEDILRNILARLPVKTLLRFSIRKTVSVPRPTANIRSDLYFEDCFGFGFGFDSINHDYKVSSAFVNGACHWAADSKEWCLEEQCGGELNVIVFFNLAEEKIGEMIVPVICRDDLAVNVIVFDGLLSLVALTGQDYSRGSYSIWQMKEYGDARSWTKLFNIEHLKGQVDDFIGFKKNGELFSLAKEGRANSGRANFLLKDQKWEL
ncbi:unnamed protein product [Dovyalis caffra]|uniref:F-box protein n=1 Tax=Dovyalis caffra TaxID=77055 RepID=A0AAV1QUK5_9ROSI|nr:unnamed protein product [Dovyalis caffra]